MTEDVITQRAWNETPRRSLPVSDETSGSKSFLDAAGSLHWTTPAIVLLIVAATTAVAFGMLMLRPLADSHAIHLVSLQSDATVRIGDAARPPAMALWPINATNDAESPGNMKQNNSEVGTVQTLCINADEAASDDFADRLIRLSPTAPMVVHLSGVPSVHERQAVLSTSDSNSEKKSRPINCSRIIHRLKTRSKPTLVWIHAERPEQVRSDQFPESDAYEFQNRLLSELDQNVTTQPIALVIDHSNQWAARNSTLQHPAPRDRNGNGLWECSEWLASHAGEALKIAREREPSTPPRTMLPSQFIWVSSQNENWDFPIAPMATVNSMATQTSVTVPPENTANESTLSDSAESRIAFDAVDALSPSMAVAAWSLETAGPTRDATLAGSMLDSWNAAVRDATTDQAARQWLTENGESAEHWHDIRLAQRIIDLPIPWAVRRDLLQTSFHIERLKTSPFVSQPFSDRWQTLRNQWRDLLRRGRVRDDIDRSITDSVDPIECRRLAAAASDLFADVDVMQRAREAIDAFDSDVTRWVNADILRGLPRSSTVKSQDDPGCDVLSAAVMLKDLVASTRLESSQQVNEALTKLNDTIAKRTSAGGHDAAHADQPISIQYANACRRQRDQLAIEWRSQRLESVSPTTSEQLDAQLMRMAGGIIADQRGGDRIEKSEARRSLNQIQDWLNAIGLERNITMPRSIELTCTGNMRFLTADDATLRLTARASDGLPVHGKWQLQPSDDSVWNIKSTSGGDSADDDAQFWLSKLKLPHQPQWFNVEFKTDTDSYRLDVFLPTAMQPIAKIDWTGGDPTKLLPNTTTPLAMKLQSLDSAFRRASVRLLAARPVLDAATNSILDSFAGTINGDMSSQVSWNESNAIVLAEVDAVTLAVDGSALVKFPTIKLDPKSPIIDASSLRLEIQDLDSSRIQCVEVVTAVSRPTQWLAPEVRINATRDAVVVKSRWADGIEPPDTPDGLMNLRMRLMESESGRVVSKTSLTTVGQVWPDATLSTAGTDRPMDLVIDALGWPSSFRYRIDPAGTLNATVSESELRVSPIVSGIRWHGELASEFGPPDASTSVAVDVGLSDHEFAYGQDRIAIGFDQNRNRYLEPNETIATATSPVHTEFQWAGVDAKGRIQLTNVVTPQRFQIPLQPYKNQRVDLMAEFRRGDNRWPTESTVCIVDHQPPQVTRVTPSSESPHAWGDPITLLIQCDDHGLTGVQRVEAAWAIEGDLKFGKNVKPIPAGRQADGSWTVTLATKPMPTGMAVAMVRVLDQVGNVSDIATCNIHLQTPAEIVAFQNRPTSAVEGKVMYVTVPVAGLNVQLQPTANDTKETPIETTTDSSGTFLFPKVKPGAYQVIVDGMYRGTRRVEQVDVEVPAHQMTRVPQIQIR